MRASRIKQINKKPYAKAKQKRGKREKERDASAEQAKAVAYLFCPGW